MREVRPEPDLGDRQLDRAHPRVPRSRPAPIPIRGPLARALVPLGTDQAGDLCFHQGLGEHPNPVPKDVAVLLLEELANERRQIHSGLRHRVNTSVCASPARENSRKDARWRLILSTPLSLPNFHHVLGL